MALFFGHRDADFVKKINLEIIVDIIDTEVDYFKISLEHSTTNVYDEVETNMYYEPVPIACLINRNDQNYNSNEFGETYTQPIEFGMIRDVLKDLNLVPEAGDIISWDSDYYLVDAVIENEYFGGKNQETWNRGAATHGLNISLILPAHKVRNTIPKIIDTRSGNQTNNDTTGEFV